MRIVKLFTKKKIESDFKCKCMSVPVQFQDFSLNFLFQIRKSLLFDFKTEFNDFMSIANL